ncbi:MAG: ATPase, T2SS/T4P/T4SS family, partial [Planctomycetota bacterium]
MSALDRMHAALALCIAQKASDVHLTANETAAIRVDGELRREGAVLDAEDVAAMAAALLDERHRAALEKQGSVDLAVESQGARFRLNIFKARGTVAVSARRLEDRIRSFPDLHLPRSIEQLAELRDGLVLMTGPTGSGKTTTLATLVHAIHSRRPCHIVTIEDPIEYLHGSGA